MTFFPLLRKNICQFDFSAANGRNDSLIDISPRNMIEFKVENSSLQEETNDEAII